MPEKRDDFAIRHVASLARLKLTKEEEVLYAKQVGEILEFAKQLLQVDVRAPEPTTSESVAPMLLREDQVRASVAREVVLASAPDHDSDKGLYRVPRVIG